MKFWLLDYSPRPLLTSRAGKSPASGSLWERIKPKQKDVMRNKVIPQVGTVFTLGMKQDFWNCYRVMAGFGGFFSFRSTVSGEEGTFINGISFYSVNGRYGRSFVSYDNFPWDSEKLNSLFFDRYKKHLIPTIFGPRFDLPMFGVSSVENDNQQEYNFAAPYVGYLGERKLFIGREFRDAEAFRRLYDKNKLCPVVVRRSNNLVRPFLVDSTFVCDLKQLELSTFSTCFTTKTCINHKGIIARNNLLSRGYESFADEANAWAADAATARVFSKKLHKFFTFAQRSFVFTSKTPYWFRSYYLEWTRSFYLRKTFPSFSEHLLHTSSAIYRFFKGRSASWRHIKARLVNKYTHTGSWATDMSRGAVSAFLGGLTKISQKRHKRRTFVKLVKDRVLQKFRSPTAVSFMVTRNQLNTINEYEGYLGEFLPALTHYRTARKYFGNKRKNRQFKINLAARWVLPGRALVGRRGRKKALMRR